ncbi:phosphorylase [Photobacterium piscicola]|uniref:phosphorylase n=1 Tax=Photobacterium piscicola TaxID=1378299 RepID=UPI002E18B500|nr:phosphorylase [Photobacterium piscicola]
MLWDKALTVANDAREAQVLLPIATTSSVVSEQGIDFSIKVMNDNLTKKIQQGQTGNNPFLPYEEQMFVDNVGHEHVCLLNKYPIGEPHLLICSKAFVSQSSLLDLYDFSAWIQGVTYTNVLGFFNSASEAGASQRHRHMQLMKTVVPLEEMILSGKLPFRHKLFTFDRINSEKAYFCYLAAMHDLGLTPNNVIVNINERIECLPYNILLTEHWMLVIPRLTNHIGDIFANALNYSGCFLVKDQQQYDWLTDYGCLRLLTECAAK